MKFRGLTLRDSEVVASTFDECLMQFRPHQDTASQLRWQFEGDWCTVFDRVGWSSQQRSPYQA